MAAVMDQESGVRSQGQGQGHESGVRIRPRQMTSAKLSSTLRKYRQPSRNTPAVAAAETPSSAQGTGPPRHAARKAPTKAIIGFKMLTARRPPTALSAGCMYTVGVANNHSWIRNGITERKSR